MTSLYYWLSSRGGPLERAISVGLQEFWRFNFALVVKILSLRDCREKHTKPVQLNLIHCYFSFEALQPGEPLRQRKARPWLKNKLTNHMPRLCFGPWQPYYCGWFPTIHLISHDLAQVMELENIVANTVYLKARESEYCVRVRRERLTILRPKERKIVVVSCSASSRTLDLQRTVMSLSDSISTCVWTCPSLLQVKLKAGVRNGKNCWSFRITRYLHISETTVSFPVVQIVCPCDGRMQRFVCSCSLADNLNIVAVNRLRIHRYDLICILFIQFFWRMTEFVKKNPLEGSYFDCTARATSNCNKLSTSSMEW